jgi:hypothetical protein
MRRWRRRQTISSSPSPRRQTRRITCGFACVQTRSSTTRSTRSSLTPGQQRRGGLGSGHRAADVNLQNRNGCAMAAGVGWMAPTGWHSLDAEVRRTARNSAHSDPRRRRSLDRGEPVTYLTVSPGQVNDAVTGRRRCHAPARGEQMGHRVPGSAGTALTLKGGRRHLGHDRCVPVRQAASGDLEVIARVASLQNTSGPRRPA